MSVKTGQLQIDYRFGHSGIDVAYNIRLSGPFGIFHQRDGFRDQLLADELMMKWEDQEGQEFNGSFTELTDHFVNCSDIRVRIVDKVTRSWGWNEETGKYDRPIDEGGLWKLKGNEFTLPEVVLFSPKGVGIAYHPIVSDSSQIELESAWLQTIVEDRRGFAENIDRMMPLGADYLGFNIGGAIVVSSDEGNTRSSCKDRETGPLYRALSQLRSQYPNGVGVNNYSVTFRVGVMSERMAEKYCLEGVLGYGYIGQMWSVFRHEVKQPYDISSATIEHELGHNLGLPHTVDDPDYPTNPIYIDNDAFLIESYFIQVIHRLEASQTHALMFGGLKSGRMWLSEYNWNKILDFIDRETSSVSARAVAGGDQRWICNGEH